MRQWLNTKEKCILRDLIKIELKSLDKDDYGKYKYFPYEYAQFTDFWGKGLGTATRAGAMLSGQFGFAEISWSRPISENGLLVGSLFLIWRIWITKDLLKICINCIKSSYYLPIFLFGAAGPVILFSPLGQPTNLGFAVFGSGLCLAAALAKKPA